MERIDPARLAENFIELIGREWMLVTAGSPEKFNTMTASWGGAGFLWNRPVAFVFVRPERYTYEFMERETCYPQWYGETHGGDHKMYIAEILNCWVR
jgi:hypothetical protein